MAQVAREAPKTVEHGQNLFIYGHVRTNQIIYALSRTMNNNTALRQLPFLGKRTVPRKLRKDFWQPLATVTFPSGRQGLLAYHKLREFRVRHEHEWNDVDTTRKSNISRKKDIARQLQDQKANSIADLAAVLRSQEQAAETQQRTVEQDREIAERTISEAKQRLDEIRARKAKLRPRIAESQEACTEYKDLKRDKMRIQKAFTKPIEWKALKGEYEVLNDTAPPAKRGPGRRRGMKAIPRMTMQGIRIEWADVQDAEFAETWPGAVVHDKMERVRNIAPIPSVVHQELPEVEAAKIEKQERLAKTFAPSSTIKDQSIEEQQPAQSRLERLVVRLRDGA